MGVRSRMTPVTKGNMRAAFLHGFNDIRIDQVATPRMGPEDVFIKVRACSICSSDYDLFTGTARGWLSGHDIQFPRSIGHEFCGEVVEVGGAVRSLAVGDRVVAPIGMVGCGTCKNCRVGRYSICLAPPKHEWTGCFAEYISIPSKAAYRLPENISDEVAPALEPACVAYWAVRRAGVQLVENVAILGLGAIGLVAVQCAKLFEPAKLIVTDLMDFRLDLAKELGADVAINAADKGYVQQIRDLTDGTGVDRVVITAGAAGILDDAIQMVRRGGVIVVSGLSAQSETFVMSRFLIKELDILASYDSPGVWDEVIALVADGKIKLEPLCTHFFALNDIDKAFTAYGDAAKEKAIRVVVRCSAGANA